MRVVGVLDLLHRRAVHARGGARDRYAPVEHVAGSRIPAGDPVALARAYVDRLGIAELYAADLDAILGRPPQTALIAELARVGVPLWVDAAVSSAAHATRLRGAGVDHVVVGLETLRSYDVLHDICAAVGDGSVAFSLDLRGGTPVAPVGHAPSIEPAERIAVRAADAGVGVVIVLDLARVGASVGPDVELLSRVRRAVPQVTLLAGGGIRSDDDLASLAAVGCDGALVATALLDGRLGAHRSETR